MRAFDLSICAQASHTPAPLERGALRCYFLFGNEGGVVCFPSGEGTKGCVTERDAKLECFETNAEYFGLSLLTGYRKTFL